MERIDHIVSAGAAARGDEVAVRFGEQATTWAELELRVAALASWLAANTEPGGRVGYLGRNSDVVLELLFGCARASRVYVGLNWRATDNEITAMVNDTGVTLLVTDASMRGRVEAIVSRAPQLTHLDEHPWRDPANRQIDVAAQWSADLDEVALLIHTSGTTGVAKAAMHTHRVVRSAIAVYRDVPEGWAAPRPGRVLVTHFPMFHIGGLHSALHVLEGGGSVVILDQFDATQVADLIERHRVPVVQMVPTMLAAMLELPDIERRDLTCLEYILYGGSPMPLPLLQRARAVFDCEFVQHYGSTECFGMATYLGAAAHHRADSGPQADKTATVGVPFPGIDVQVVDAAGEPAPVGALGEICVQSPALMVGYWGAPEATADVLRDGWLHTGDVGTFDGDGYLTLRDRLHDVISSGGETISPREVEAAIVEHPAVADVAVVRAPHAKWGETPCAFVVLEHGAHADAETLRAHAASRLASYKLPTMWNFVSELPRNSLGKVLKGRLVVDAPLREESDER